MGNSWAKRFKNGSAVSRAPQGGLAGCLRPEVVSQIIGHIFREVFTQLKSLHRKRLIQKTKSCGPQKNSIKKSTPSKNSIVHFFRKSGENWKAAQQGVPPHQNHITIWQSIYGGESTLESNASGPSGTGHLPGRHSHTKNFHIRSCDSVPSWLLLKSIA